MAGGTAGAGLAQSAANGVLRQHEADQSNALEFRSACSNLSNSNRETPGCLERRGGVERRCISISETGKIMSQYCWR